MVSRKDKDAENGLQILGILSVIWSAGFFYMTRNGDFLGIGMGQFSIACCGIINILLTVIFLASWRYTARENKVKDYLEEYIKSHNSVSLKHLIEEFKLSNSAAYKALTVWIIESGIKGTLDPKSGAFIREPVETVSSEIIDVEFHEVPDEPLSFCPNCGSKMETGFCDKCQVEAGDSETHYGVDEENEP